MPPSSPVRSRRTIAIVAAGLIAAAIVSLVALRLTEPSAITVRQQIAVPAYIDPLTGADSWHRLVDAPHGTVGIAIANVAGGPGTAPLPQWTSVIRSAHRSGITVLGYVDTGYLGSTGHPTAAGTSTPAAWIAQATAQAASWYSYYGRYLGGIFFDEAPATCGASPGSDAFANAYRELSAAVTAAHPGATTVLNPGTEVPHCFAGTADAIVTFEGSASSYLAPAGSSTTSYHPPSWTPSTPRGVWQIVFGVQSIADLDRVLALSEQRRSGYVFVTSATLPDPYDALPAPQFWSAELKRVASNNIEQRGT